MEQENRALWVFPERYFISSGRMLCSKIAHEVEHSKLLQE